MKKTLSILLALIMSLSLLGSFSVSAAEVYDGTSVSASLAGAGTEADPYLIANGADLAYFAANAVAGASYKLTADIIWANAPTANNWTPVPTFSGTFDGNGYSEEWEIEAARRGLSNLKTTPEAIRVFTAKKNVALFAAHVGKNVKIKAAGGIRSFEDAEDFVKLGATRLGTSALVKLMKAEEVKGY